jgi:hypothetical protein
MHGTVTLQSQCTDHCWSRFNRPPRVCVYVDEICDFSLTKLVPFKPVTVCKCLLPLEVSVLNGSEVIWEVNTTCLEQRIDFGLCRILSYALKRGLNFVRLFKKMYRTKEVAGIWRILWNTLFCGRASEIHLKNLLYFLTIWHWSFTFKF